MNCRRTFLLWLPCVSVLIFGVSCSNEPDLSPVQGKVVLKGQPLGGARVIFHPAAEGNAPTDWPAAVTNDDGTFTLKTAGHTGAPVGNYKVSIVCMEKSTSKPVGMSMPEDVDRLKGAYSNPATSKLSVEVKAGSNDLAPFELK